MDLSSQRFSQDNEMDINAMNNESDIHQSSLPFPLQDEWINSK